MRSFLATPRVRMLLTVAELDNNEEDALPSGRLRVVTLLLVVALLLLLFDLLWLFFDSAKSAEQRATRPFQMSPSSSDRSALRLHRQHVAYCNEPCA